MASINNLEVKGVKLYPDHEGAMIPYGNIYFKGKRVASFRTDSWGGPMAYEHTHKTITEKEVLDAFAEIPEKLGWDEFYNSIEILVGELIELKELESEFKKAQKREQILIVSKCDNSIDPFKEMKNLSLPTTGYFISESATQSEMDKFTKEIVEEKNEVGIITVYRSLNDFII